MSHGIEIRNLVCTCDKPGKFLCDYPMGNGITCDAAMCAAHRYELPLGQDFCLGHGAIVEAAR